LTVELGTIEITKAVADNRRLIFLPGALRPGIQAEDPMIKAPTEAYQSRSGAGTKNE